MQLTHEVVPLRAEVAVQNGDRLRVVFFLRPMGVEAETLADRLNDRSTSFLPAEVEGDAVASVRQR